MELDVTSTGTCKATRRDGLPCRSWALASGFCFAHDPARAGQLAEARRRGGHARHGRKIGATGKHDPVTLAGPGDLLKLIESEVNTVLELEASLSRARTVGYLAGVFVTTWESSELEARVSALEARADGQS